MTGIPGQGLPRPDAEALTGDSVLSGNVWQHVISCIAVLFAGFHLYTALFGILEGMQQRVYHIGFALVLVFLTRPLFGGKGGRPGIIDAALAIAALISTSYLIYEDRGLAMRLGIAYERDVILGTMFIVVLLEATRRVAGIALAILCTLTIIYAYFGRYMPQAIAHGGFDLEDITVNLYLTTEGIFGTPLAISSTYIILFVILGGMLQASGAAQFISDLAYGLFGRVRGGPAKVAVFASGLFGMISGSAVANVASTGVLTIPLMRKTGFSARFAGAVEAVASSCGQFTPPIMAAAGFVIAESLGVPYLEVATAAIIPAFLYFAALFIAVDLRAANLGIKGESKDKLPPVGPTFMSGGYLLLVPITLVLMMAGFGYSPLRAAIFTIGVNLLLFLGRELFLGPRSQILTSLALLIAIHLAVIIISHVLSPIWAVAVYVGLLTGVGVIAHKTRQQQTSAGFVWQFTDKTAAALRAGALGSLEVAIACASAGIIIGMLMLTGLGLRLSGLLLDISGGNLPVLLMLTMIASLILGMGMPTLGAYIVLAVLIAPSLVQMGVHPMAAHLFIFYFGVISSITPPVCMAAFAAAAISGAGPMRTGFTAFRLGIVVFIIPFVMIYNPAMIMQGSVGEIVVVAFTALLGSAALAASLEGYLLRRMNLVERGAILCGGLLLLSGDLLTDLLGGGLLLATLGMQLRMKMKDERTER
ncbi:MAG: TRAP transporter fused permease subunit [Rhodospirillales bacterium]